MREARVRSALQIALYSALLASGCSADGAAEAEVPLAGADTTVVDRTSHAYRQPAPNLSATELARHLDGDVAFEAKFVSAPATINPGLGPLFNNNACARCHIGDGRGMPAAGQGSLGSSLLVRTSIGTGEPRVPGGSVAAGELGTQLHDHAIVGHSPEATVGIHWTDVAGEYGDGEPYALRAPRFEIQLRNGEPLPRNIMTSARIPPPVFGLGLLEAVPEDALRRLSDPDDADGDGVSGRLNMVWDEVHGTTAPGRFGWKANIPSLLQQAAAAYSEDMGVSSPVFPDTDGTSDIDEHTLGVTVFYTQTLAVPRRERWDDRQVLRGEALFRDVGCAACHADTLQTADHEIPALRHQTIHPYTDLLLHNMGFDLADGRPDFLASGTEWRTAPLWGLGLAQTVLPYCGLLHDGRARSVEEAILWHGGEAESSKESFRMLSARERGDLLAFLRSL